MLKAAASKGFHFSSNRTIKLTYKILWTVLLKTTASKGVHISLKIYSNESALKNSVDHLFQKTASKGFHFSLRRTMKLTFKIIELIYFKWLLLALTIP